VTSPTATRRNRTGALTPRNVAVSSSRQESGAIATSLVTLNGGGPLAAPVGGAHYSSIALTASLA
jgi:hypothetical protein